MRGKLSWIAAALIAGGAILAVSIVLLSGSDDDNDGAGTDVTAPAAMSPVGASVPAPSSPQAQAAAIAAVERFWTPQRLRDALNNPLSEPPRSNAPEQPASSSPKSSTPASAEAEAEPTAPASAPESRSTKSAASTQGRCKQPRLLRAEPGYSYARFCYRGPLSGYPALTTGRLIMVAKRGLGYCTATVAAATNESVLFTAGHCVVTPAAQSRNKKPRWTKMFGFIPSPLVKRFHQALDSPNGAARLKKLRSEIWWALPIRGTKFSTVWSPRPWIQQGHYSHDFAAVVIAPRIRDDGSPQTIQWTLGSQGWDMGGRVGFSSPRLLGFPSKRPFNGRKLFECQGVARLVQRAGDPGPELKVGCDQSPGSSGGPWLGETNSEGFGKIISVNSNGPPNLMYGPRLSSIHLDAMTKAQTTNVGG